MSSNKTQVALNCEEIYTGMHVVFAQAFFKNCVLIDVLMCVRSFVVLVVVAVSISILKDNNLVGRIGGDTIVNRHATFVSYITIVLD